MPIVLNISGDAPPETVPSQDGSQRNARIGGWCAMCEFAFDGTNFDLRTIGTHGAICDECTHMAFRSCDECGEDGWCDPFDWFTRGHFIIGLRNRMEMHLTRAHGDRWRDDHELRDRSRDAVYEWARRMGNFDPACTPPFWGIHLADYPTLTRVRGDNSLCDECVAYCEDCNDAFSRDEIVEHNGGLVCHACAMPRCERCCERWETEWEAEACCRVGVHDYSFRPDFLFWHMKDGTLTNSLAVRSGFDFVAPTDELFLGIELETECGADAWEQFLADAGEDWEEPSFVYGKNDGSLDESGIELVTMPATMDAFMQRFPWDALQRWNGNGARSFYRGSCGLHIHVSRSHFTPMHLWRFVAWQMRNQSFCEKIAQRDSSQWARWQSLGEFGTEYKPTLSDVVKGKESNGERYVAINFQNEHTVELRYFRGNLRADAIRMRVEFVDALARFTRNMTAREVMQGALTVERFANFVSAHSHRYSAMATFITDNMDEWEAR